MGRKKRPYYRIVAVDSRSKRDGAFIDRLGYYHPIEDPAGLMIDGEKALEWLRNGAIPSDTVLSLLKREGIWLRFRLEKRGLPASQIETMMAEWFAKHHKPIKTKPAKAAAKAKPVESSQETPEPETAPVGTPAAGETPDAVVAVEAEPEAMTPAPPSDNMVKAEAAEASSTDTEQSDAGAISVKTEVIEDSRGNIETQA